MKVIFFLITSFFLYACGDSNPDDSKNDLSGKQKNQKPQDLNLLNKYGFSEAVKAGDVTAVETFLSLGVDPCSEDATGYPALFVACRQGHASVVSSLLKAGANPDGCLEDGIIFPLGTAAFNNHTEVLSILLKNGADPNKQSSVLPETALHRASKEGHIEALNILLESSADPTIKNYADKTAKDVAKTEAVRRIIVSKSTSTTST